LNRETKKPTSLSSDILAAGIHRNPAAATRLTAMCGRIVPFMLRCLIQRAVVRFF